MKWIQSGFFLDLVFFYWESMEDKENCTFFVQTVVVFWLFAFVLQIELSFVRLCLCSFVSRDVPVHRVSVNRDTAMKNNH